MITPSTAPASATSRTHLLLIAGLLACSALAGPCWAQAQPAATADKGEDDADDEAPSPSKAPRAARGRSAFKWGVDGVRVEAGAWPSAPEAERGATLRAQPYLQWQPSASWELRLGARLDGDWQSGGAQSVDRLQGMWGDSYLRYRHEDTRVSLGAQTIIWGRVDGVPVIDRVSRVDLRRFGLDELAERRLPQWALRWEQGLGDFKLDTVWLPHFQASELPEDGSVWHPVSRSRAQIIGVEPAPALSEVFRRANLVEQEDGSGGLAMRLTRTGEPFDLGFTLAHTRQPLPYFQLDVAQARLTMLHPYTRFAAVDAELVYGNATWRTELGYTRDLPLTLNTGAMLRAAAIDWVGAVEFFPGGKNTRLNIQLVAHVARTSQSVLEVKRYYGANGEIETSFGQGQWKAALRFATGFNVRDNYVSPKISFSGWEPHEVYVAAHLFGGEARALAGFHRQHDMLVVGIKTRF